MTTVGYGDIAPITANERLFNIVSIIIACGVFAYTVGSIGETVSRQNRLAAQFKEKINYVNQFLRLKKTPPDLKRKIRSYLEYTWEKKKKIKIEESEVFELLNESLSEQILCYKNAKILKSITVFIHFDIQFLSQLSTQSLDQETSLPSEEIVVEGEPGESLFFIISGKTVILE